MISILIDRYNGGHRKIKEIMAKLGFIEYKMKRYFVHKDTSLFIEFPRGPLGVGDAPVKEVSHPYNRDRYIKTFNTD